jgi:thioredoxin-related protein
MFRPVLTALLYLSSLLPFHSAWGGPEKAPMLGVGHFTMPEWFKPSFLDLGEDIGEAAGEGKRLIVFFHQDGCPYCAKLINHNFSQKPLVDDLRAHFDIIQINMWGDRELITPEGRALNEKTYAREMKVWFTPTVLFFNETGRVVFRMNGYYPPEKFRAVLRYVAQRRESLEPFHVFYRPQGKSAAHGGGLIREDFFSDPPHDLRGHAPLAVFFEQSDCPACEDLHRDVLNREETRRQLRALRSVQLDRWGNEPVITPEGRKTSAREWADRLGVNYLPTVVFFDRGREVIRSEAMFKAFHTQSMMEYVSSGAYRNEDEFQRYIHARGERLRERGVTVDLWE